MYVLAQMNNLNKLEPNLKMKISKSKIFIKPNLNSHFNIKYSLGCCVRPLKNIFKNHAAQLFKISTSAQAITGDSSDL